MASITLDDIHVEFPLYQGGSRSLKKSVIWRGTGGAMARDAADRIVVKALNGVSLRIEHGERVGLIGPNGAGKTTLLRVLSGIYEPVRGRIEVEGRVSPLFDVGLGIDQDATGYENIELRGLFLGLSPREIRERTAEIAEFTELGDYLDMPVRTYSAGMALRLAFAVSTCIRPDVLLMDEWIGAGDAHFLEKAERRLRSLVDRSSIVVIASHSTSILRRLCTRLLLFDRGRVVATGDVDEVLEGYAGMRAA